MTARQQEILTFFLASARREGVPPTVREVARHFGVAPRAAFDHLRALARQGHLRRREGAGRAHPFVPPAPLPESAGDALLVLASLRARIEQEPASDDAVELKHRILKLIDAVLA